MYGRLVPTQETARGARQVDKLLAKKRKHSPTVWCSRTHQDTAAIVKNIP